MPIPGNIPGNPGIEKFIPVFPGTAFPGNTRGPTRHPVVQSGSVISSHFSGCARGTGVFV